jgi:hypothetical protein
LGAAQVVETRLRSAKGPETGATAVVANTKINKMPVNFRDFISQFSSDWKEKA